MEKQEKKGNLVPYLISGLISLLVAAGWLSVIAPKQLAQQVTNQLNSGSNSYLGGYSSGYGQAQKDTQLLMLKQIDAALNKDKFVEVPTFDENGQQVDKLTLVDINGCQAKEETKEE